MKIAYKGRWLHIEQPGRKGVKLTLEETLELRDYIDAHPESLREADEARRASAREAK